VSDTLELALAARVPRGALADCVAYVELAAALFGGRPVAEAVGAIGRGGLGPGGAGTAASAAADVGSGPRLTGEGPADAVGAGVWALRQPGGLAEVMPVLARVGTPGVAAAVGGLLGLRDGCAGMPAHWQRRARGAAACLALAPGLVRARCRDHAARAPDDRAFDRPPGDASSESWRAPVPPEITPLGGGVSMCRPLGRLDRSHVGRKRLVDAVGAR
jgi:hypothetical protein